MEKNEKRVIPNDRFFATVEEMIAERRSVDILVKGFSMRPFLGNCKHTVTLSPIEPEKIRKGMVVLFRKDSAHILHRFRGVNSKGELVMKGDGNYRIVELVPRDSVVAYVSRVKCNGRGYSYGSFVWYARGFWSLVVKWLRTRVIDVKRVIKK
jgi:hypothetical protein